MPPVKQTIASGDGPGEPSALGLYGSLKSKIPFTSIRDETEAAERAMAEEAVRKGLDGNGGESPTKD